MIILQASDFATIKFKEDKLSLQKEIIERQYLFASLFEFLSNSKTQNKASWILSGVVENQPNLIKENEIGMLIKLLEVNVPITVERNIWRVFQFIDIPKMYREKCIHLAFETLENKKSSIAVQIFAMSTAFELSKTNNSLKYLLKEILLFNIENASKGYQSRARKILRAIN